ncbi:ankyrin repeat domain-containing protein [Wolbachia endosymbiont (group B) of Erynnis tages]|uniref:ankyrin repeat domain-containing protein n=1 Tax=Wolbachia endosymbiont (group B) of Erynnis tages TaxID=2954011 RepID=UPI00222721B8|nr:ankyrin repeat domain-containing protein [Wolbachia endosymbiont (group B) of Erynnis tages]
MKKLERLRKNLFAAIDELNIKKVKRYVKKARCINKEKEIINGKKDGMAPIHLAVYKGSLEIVRFLLKNNANINAVSDGCLVPYSYVTNMSSKTEIKEMIYHCTSSTTSQVMQGFTALHLAFFYCRLDIASFLLNNKAIDLNIRSANGKIAFEVIPGYESLCSDGCDIKKIFLAVLRFHKNNCTELLLSARTNSKLELEAGDTPDAASSTAGFSLSPTKAIKTELEVNNTKDLASSTVNSSFTLIRENFEEVSSTASNAVKPFSFTNSIFSGITTTISGLFSSATALPPAQQSVDHLDGNPIGSSQVDFNGIALLTDVMIRKFTEKKYSRPLDDSLLTIQEIRERKLNTIEKNFETALSKCEKLYQCPESSLSNLTISKGMHQKSL